MCMSNGDLGAKNAKRNHIGEDCSALHNARKIVTMSQLVKVKYRYLLQGTYFAFPNLVTIFNTTSTKKDSRLQSNSSSLPTCKLQNKQLFQMACKLLKLQSNSSTP